MTMLANLLDGLFIILQIITGTISTYQITIGLAGFFRKKERCVHAPEKSFAVIVAAHNEEQVIAPLLENLKLLDYPKELFDIFVICDNCTDRTADIVRAHNLYAMERFNSEKRGKGHALEWMFEKLWQRKRQYDAVVIFDADNLVSRNFLREMNEKLIGGSKVVQAYLDTKNPYDSWVTISYAVTYWFMNRMWQLARYNLKMANSLGGTGICVDTDLLKEMGWNATSLTEDVEFTARCVEREIYPSWAHNAIVYDEKPLTLASSMKQRLRWMQGHFYCARHYFWPLLFKSARTRNLSQFDAALYLFQPMRLLIVALTTLMLYLQVATPLYDQLGLTKTLPNWFWWAINIALYAQTPLAMMIERVPLRGYLGLLAYPVFLITWIPVTVVAFFTSNNTEWSHTAHTRSMRIEDVS